MKDKNRKRIIQLYTKKFKKAAKEARPWDWGYLLEDIRLHIEYMYDYYTKCQVYITDEDKKEIIDSLEKCINIYKKLDIIWDDLQIEESIIDKETNKVNLKVDEQQAKQFIEKQEREHQLYIELFNTIRDNFNLWWD